MTRKPKVNCCNQASHKLASSIRRPGQTLGRLSTGSGWHRAIAYAFDLQYVDFHDPPDPSIKPSFSEKP
jgi:hypothetical protein